MAAAAEASTATSNSEAHDDDGTQLDRTLHLVLETFVERGYAPHYTEIAARFGVGPEEGKKLVHDLAATGLPVWLYPGTDLIASCAPFNNQPTQYRLSVDGRPGWFGQCGFESLAACWAFPGKALQIDSPCLDGKNETWAFTESDRSIAAGAVHAGSRWGRPDDEAGLGVVVSGLSDPHRRCLAAGGYGFIIGDGALKYAPEILGDYRLALAREVAVGINYQPIDLLEPPAIVTERSTHRPVRSSVPRRTPRSDSAGKLQR